jgi:hypothetical protein
MNQCVEIVHQDKDTGPLGNQARLGSDCSFPVRNLGYFRQRVQWGMQVIAEHDSRTIERLRSQSKFLLRIYRSEFAKDPTSHATEASRSNMIALRHTIKQIYGEAVAEDV